MMAVEYHYTQNNLEELKTAIAAVKIDKLLSPQAVISAMGAFEVVGMEEEAELAREQGKKELYNFALQSWLLPDNAAIMKTLLLAIVLKDPKGVPEEWIENLRARVKDKFSRYNLLVGVARLKEDWAEAAEVSAKAIADFPTYYHFYYARGQALHHLGRRQEALEPLKIYAAHAKNERDCRQAEAWIKDMETETAQALR